MIFIRILVLNFAMCTIAQASAPSKDKQEKIALYIDVESEWDDGFYRTTRQEVSVHEAAQSLSKSKTITLCTGKQVMCTLSNTFIRDSNKSGLELILATLDGVKETITYLKKCEDAAHDAQVRKKLAEVEAQTAALVAKKAALEAQIIQPTAPHNTTPLATAAPGGNSSSEQAAFCQ